MKALSTLATILSVILLISCSEDDVKKQQVYPKVAMDIMGAEHLAVMEIPEYGRIAGTSTNFYKVTADGSLEAVKYVYPNGVVADSAAYNDVQVSVSQVYNLTDDYVLLNGSFIWPDTLGKPSYYRSILVRKSDGAMYDFGFGMDYQITQTGYRGDEPIKKDGAGNIYFLFGGVSQVNLEDPEQLTLTGLLPSGQNARHFEISYDGLLMYEYNETYDDFRIKKPDGGIFKVDLAGRNNRSFWRGINGALYLLTSNGFGQTAIHQITFVGGEIIIKDVWSGNVDIGWWAYSNEKIMMDNSILFINPGTPQGSWEFSEVDNSVKMIELPFAEYKSKLVYSDSYYYIATSDALYKIDKSNHTYTALLAPNTYEVYTMSVDNNDKVRFSGLRFQDGRKVFAEIDKDGALTTLDEELNQAATILQRIN